MRGHNSIAGLAVMLLFGCVGWPNLSPSQREVGVSMLEGRELTRAFFQGNLESLWVRMTPEMRDAAGGSLGGLRSFREKVAELAGDEVKVLDEAVSRDGERDVYRRTSVFTKMTGPLVVQWALDIDGTIADFFVRPAESAESVVYQAKTKLHLPFDGEWYVTAGGRTVEQNHHSVDYSNRFAYDLVSAEEFDRPVALTRNEYFATWGIPILAPASGTVAELRDTVPDNVPNEINDDPSVRIGNFVSIDHGNGEFSVLGHLQKGSVRVVVGDRIRLGETVGLAGNSGNSNGPHLHYNLQDRAEPNRGKGLPAQFVDFIADGQFVSSGELVQGQRIRSE